MSAPMLPTVHLPHSGVWTKDAAGEWVREGGSSYRRADADLSKALDALAQHEATRHDATLRAAVAAVCETVYKLTLVQAHAAKDRGDASDEEGWYADGDELLQFQAALNGRGGA